MLRITKPQSVIFFVIPGMLLGMGQTFFSCSPKMCGDSSICQCHNKLHKHKVGTATVLDYQEGEKKNKPDWYKKGAGLKKDNRTKSEEENQAIVFTPKGEKKNTHHKYKAGNGLRKDKSKRKKREKF